MGQERHHLLEIGIGHVHLWLLPLNDDAAMADRDGYAACLSQAETERSHCFHFENDRFRFSMTRALVRRTLSLYASTAPSEWTFATNAHGRPHISGPRCDDGLTFNLSHTHDLVVLAVGRHQRIGVDTERIDRAPAAAEIAQRFFAASEAAALHRVFGPDRDRLFMEYWTMKEAYIKARGLGLAIPLDQFAFDLAGSTISLSVRPDDDHRSHRWQFAQLLMWKTHVVAVCCEPPPDRRMTLVIKAAGSHQPIGECDAALIRTSDRPNEQPIFTARRKHPIS